jgi:hypothetical protein
VQGGNEALTIGELEASIGMIIGVGVGGVVLLAILIACCVSFFCCGNAKPSSQTTVTATSVAATSSAVTVDVELPDLDESVTTVTTQHDLASPPVASDEKI